MKTLNDMGLSIEIDNGPGERVNAASEYIPMTVADAIAAAKAEAENTTDAAYVAVSADRGDDAGGWVGIWAAAYDLDAELWPWQCTNTNNDPSSGEVRFV